MKNITFVQFLKNTFKKPKNWVYIVCFGFGMAAALLLAVIQEELGNIESTIKSMIIGGVIALIIGIIMAFIYKFDWSGFKDKNLWDWMQLLILPLLVAAGGLLLDHQIGEREERRAKIRRNQETLKLYFDQMKVYTPIIKPLLMKISQNRTNEKKEFEEKELDDIKNERILVKTDLETIQSLTFTVLEELNSEHKSQVIRYLYNIGLIKLEIPTRAIKNSSNPVCSGSSQQKNYFYESAIQLEGVNLSGVDFSNKEMQFVNFCGVKLNKAKFVSSNLAYANINEADLSEANLDQAVFSGIEFDDVGKIDNKYFLAIIFKNYSRNLKELQKKGSTTLETQQEENSNNEEFEPLLNGRKLSTLGKDLSNINLEKVDLSEINLTEFDLEKSDLSEANLTRAKLHGANLKGVKLDRAKLHNVEGLESATGLDKKFKLVVKILNNKVDLQHDLIGADLANVNLDDQNLTGADLRGANLEGASLKNVQLTKANLKAANLRKTDLTNAKLDEANLVEADLKNSILIKANLNKAKLTKANLTEADLQNASMHGIVAYVAIFDKAKMMDVDLNTTDNNYPTKINSSSMSEVDFSKSDLRRANFIAVDLTSSILKEAKMEGVDLLANSRLVSTDLTGVVGISKVKFENTEYLDIKLDFDPKKYPGLVKLSFEQLISSLPSNFGH